MPEIEPIFNAQTPAVSAPAVVNDDTRELAAELLSFARNNKYLSLAGMAANQVAADGVRVDLNVCFLRNDAAVWVAAFNPRIVAHIGPTFTSTEGCLTWPKRQIRAVRYESVLVEYQDRLGDLMQEEATGFRALVWQHEINHLLGVPETIVDPYVKVKPNAPCPCSSGRKYKKCCGR